jgi:hypothetical protein
MRSQRGAKSKYSSITKPERAETQTNVTRLSRRSGMWKYIGVVLENFRAICGGYRNRLLVFFTRME